MEDLDELILMQLKGIGKDVGAFIAGMLSNDLARDDQRLFALRLVRLAEHIKERADSTAGMVVEGSIVDDRDARALPGGTDGRVGPPDPAEHV
jgi:hypothetical protein